MRKPKKTKWYISVILRRRRKKMMMTSLAPISQAFCAQWKSKGAVVNGRRRRRSVVSVKASFCNSSDEPILKEAFKCAQLLFWTRGCIWLMVLKVTFHGACCFLGRDVCRPSET
ncbi:uncharacterized protein LOC141712185 isoform X2 [Apium graveolens]|uniref:uncharacterized protein LOC141712185 isoform X2 n=1 Tax=Apium graveolens TaxID=4045 RepID=UPI003D7A13C2